MRSRPSRSAARRLLVLAAALVAVALAASPANAAGVVNGAVTPAKLAGTPAAVMFFHPF